MEVGILFCLCAKSCRKGFLSAEVCLCFTLKLFSQRVRVMASESDYEREYEGESRRLRGIAERLEVLEKKLERTRKRKRVESSSESESSSDTDDGKRRRRSKKVKREKKKFRKVDRWEERWTAARKRTWNAKSHEEQFRVTDDALEPLKEAKKLAKEAGEKKIYKKVKEGERLLQERMKRLMFADTEGWSAANIYAGKVEAGSNSEDERRMRSAAKEARAAREAADKGVSRKPFRSGRASEPGTGAAVATTPARVPTSQPAQQFRELLCWGCGVKGHMQRSCPRQQRGAVANPSSNVGPIGQ